MKIKFIAALLIVMLILNGCASYRTDISRQQIIEAYESAGYQVSTGVYDEALAYGQISYVQADHYSGEYIYFTFFETSKEAEAFAQTKDHPVMMGLFSFIYGDPMWLRVDSYGCIVVEYWNSEHFLHFEKLLKGK